MSLLQSFRDRGFRSSNITSRGKLTPEATRFVKREYIFGRSIAGLLPSGYNLVETEKSISIQKEKTTKSRGAKKTKAKRRKRKFAKKKVPSNLRRIRPRAFASRNANIAQSTVSGTATVTLRSLDDPTQERVIQQEFARAGRSKAEIEQEVEEAIFRRYSRDSWEIVDIKIENITVYKQGKAIPLAQVRMREARFLEIESLGAQPWNKGKGTCVLDYLEWKYWENPKVDLDIFHSEFLDECFPLRDTEGVNIEEIIEWAHSGAQMKVIAVDEKYKMIQMYHPEKVNKHIPPLLFMIKHGHMYPIENHKDRVSLLMKYNQGNAVPKKAMEKIKENIALKNKDKKVVILETDDKERKLCEMVHTTNTDASKICCDNKGMTRFEIGNTIYVFANEGVTATQEYMGSEYRGETAMTIVRQLIDKMDMPKSRFNKQTLNVLLSDGAKDLVHAGFVGSRKDVYWKDGWKENVKTIDITKSYRSIIEKPDSEWMLFGYGAEWQMYLPEFYWSDTKRGVVPGLYIVTTDDTRLFCKSGIYDHEHVSLGLCQRLIGHTSIKYVLRPSNTLSTSYFDEFGRLRDEMNLPKDLNKLVTNGLCGMLGKTMSNNFTRYINRNKDEVDAWHYENAYKETACHSRIIDDTEYWVYGHRNQKILMENNLPMYIQIVCQQLRKVFQKQKQIGWKYIIHRKADAITFYDPGNDIDKYVSEGIGGWRECNNPTKPIKSHYSNPTFTINNGRWNTVSEVKDSNDWDYLVDMIENNECGMIQAFPGRGKSHMISELKKVYKDDLMILAPTHTAAHRIEGQTIHGGLKLSIDDPGNVPIATLNKIKNSVKAIAIDEVSMITQDIWSVFRTIKDKCEVPLLFFGDHEQLESCDGFSTYFTNTDVMDICDYNLIKLDWHEKCRHSAEDDALLHEVRLGRIDGVLECNEVRHYTERDNLPLLNICWTNAMRSDINGDVYVQELQRGNLGNPSIALCNIPNLIENMSGVAKTNFVYGAGIAENLRVMAFENKRDRWYNGMFYTIQKWHVGDDGDMVITLHDDDGNAVLVNGVMEYVNNFTLGYAVTNHKIQGATLTEKYGVWQYDVSRVSDKWRYVAVSRASNLRGGIIFYRSE